MRISFWGQTEGLMEGIRVIASDLNIELSSEGFSVEVKMEPEPEASLSISLNHGKASIIAQDKPAFFRSVGLLLPHLHEEQWDYSETRSFDRNGIMFDCSRNAVPNIGHLEYLFRKMALMGLSWAMLYTEETYELESEPYFGYCRGRYTQAELKALDDYAYALGIELVPCIQTLAHLDRFLHWQAGEMYRDTESILMVGDEKVYDLIERMVVAASTPFRSKRIHIGMDEARMLGRGKLLNQKGYIAPSTLMGEHLRRVHEIIRKHGLHAMMWSDMHFENAGPGEYYGEDKHFTKEILESAPKDIDLVYWDYYHEKENEYDRMLTKHRLFSAQTVFAGGIWAWSGIAPDYRKTFMSTIPGLTQCAKHGIHDVFATAWGDNGGECPAIATLLGLQLYAEYDYTRNADLSWVDRRFRECVGMNAESFLCLSELQYPCELPKPETGVLNACKVLLYEDPLIPLMEEDFKGKLHEHYQKLQNRIDEAVQNASTELRPMMLFYQELCHALEFKCLWREQAADAIRQKDRSKAQELVSLAAQNVQILENLDDRWRELWMYTNRSFGFEVVDGRLGWLQARFKTAEKRMEEFASGKIDDIPELSEKKLPIFMSSGCYQQMFNWAPLVSTGLV